MPFECKGICHKVEASNNRKDHYNGGVKYCPICEKHILIFTTRCLCCNTILRGKVHKYGKRRILSLRREGKIMEDVLKIE